MNKYLRGLITIFMVSLLLILSACSAAKESAESKTDGKPSLDSYLSAIGEEKKENTESKKEENKKEETEDEGPISSDIRSYEILINDELFAFPMTLSELENTSFKYIGETPLNEITAEPGIKVEAPYSNGTSTVIFNLLNTGEEDITCDKTIVAGLFINFLEEGSLKREEVILPHNLTPDYADLNSLKSVYGEPSEVFHDSQTGNPKASKLIYRKTPGLHSYTIFVDNEQKLVREIVILSDGQ